MLLAGSYLQFPIMKNAESELKYPSDITREQFEPIRELLESAKKRTKPRTVDLWEVFNGVLYVLKTGCQWRSLPKEYPKWRTVYDYFSKWKEANSETDKSILQEVLKKLVSEERVNRGRSSTTTFLIVDAQSVKNADTAEAKGYDAGKKISGIKRTLAVDTQGLPHTIGVTTANVTDRQAAIDVFETYKEDLNEVKKVLADGGYTGAAFAESVQETMGADVEIAKRSELHKFSVIPKRWIVERSFAWIEKCRRLWKNCERKLSTSLNMIVLAFIRLLLVRS